MYSYFVVSMLVTISNFWIWKIFKENYILATVLILLSLSIPYASKKSAGGKILILMLFLFLISCFIILKSGFDANLKELSIDQQKQLNERHGYLADNLDILFKNKVSLHFYKGIYPYASVYISNVFNALSPNLYFFANHPRERSIDGFIMYPSILVLPFFMGMLKFLKPNNKLIIYSILFAIFIAGFISPRYILGPVIFFPLINLMIIEGLLKVLFLTNEFKR